MPPELEREVRDEIVRLYQRQIGIPAICKRLRVGTWTVYHALERAAIPIRARGTKRVTCVECGQPSAGAKRCVFHNRLHVAARCLEANRRYLEKLNAHTRRKRQREANRRYRAKGKADAGLG